jgi:hypothetical protein
MTKTYFAVVLRSPRVIVGYVVDTYPEERAACVREHAGNIVGEFATPADAESAVCDALQSVMTPPELKH